MMSELKMGKMAARIGLALVNAYATRSPATEDLQKVFDDLMDEMSRRTMDYPQVIPTGEGLRMQHYWKAKMRYEGRRMKGVV